LSSVAAAAAGAIASVFSSLKKVRVIHLQQPGKKEQKIQRRRMASVLHCCSVPNPSIHPTNNTQSNRPNSIHSFGSGNIQSHQHTSPRTHGQLIKRSVGRKGENINTTLSQILFVGVYSSA
jgi:hypothetical protein